MDKMITMMMIPIGVLVLTVGVVLIGLNSSFYDTQKFEVSNLILTYGPGGQELHGAPQVVINFTVRNMLDSHMISVGVTIDGVDYGFSTLQVNLGETQQKSVPLNDLVLSSSKTYDVKLTFTFADGQYKTYLGSYTTPQFKGQATVTSAVLVSNHYTWDFTAVIQNKGNLPITKAKSIINNEPSQVSILNTLPGEAQAFDTSYAQDTFTAGSAYPVTIQLTYFDGSASTINTSVIAASS